MIDLWNLSSRDRPATIENDGYYKLLLDFRAEVDKRLIQAAIALERPAGARPMPLGYTQLPWDDVEATHQLSYQRLGSLPVQNGILQTLPLELEYAICGVNMAKDYRREGETPKPKPADEIQQADNEALATIEALRADDKPKPALSIQEKP